MKKRPYHHLPDGTFRNPEGSPVKSNDVKFSYRTFIKEKKKINTTVPKDHVIEKKVVKENLEKFKNDDYIAWIGHATFLIKLGETTIITDPVFSKNAGPLIFGPNINGPAFFEKTGSVIIVVFPSLIRKVACPIQPI